jgi:hypothetical protein
MAVHRRPAVVRHRSLAALAVALLCAAGCAGQPEPPDNAQICTLNREGASHAEVLAQGSIVTLLGTHAGPNGDHEGFFLKLSDRCDLVLRVETNVDLTGPVPLHTGETVIVKGEYETDPSGGVIHWTHRDPRGRHINGYVQADGKTYD